MRLYNIYDVDWNLLHDGVTFREAKQITGAKAFNSYIETKGIIDGKYRVTYSEIDSMIAEWKEACEPFQNVSWIKEPKTMGAKWEDACKPFRNVTWVKCESFGVRKLHL